MTNLFSKIKNLSKKIFTKKEKGARQYAIIAELKGVAGRKRQEIIKELIPGSDLELEINSKNFYDKKAIVFKQGNIELGYFPPDYAKGVLDILKYNPDAKLDPYIKEISYNGSYYDVIVEINIPQEDWGKYLKVVKSKSN